MGARVYEIAKLLAMEAETVDPDVTLGRRLKAEVPDDPNVLAEQPGAMLYAVPIDELRIVQRPFVLHRQVVHLAFTGPVEPGFGKEEWLALVEGFLDHLDHARMGPFHFFASSAESLWDPDALKGGRFVAVHKLTYSTRPHIRGT